MHTLSLCFRLKRLTLFAWLVLSPFAALSAMPCEELARLAMPDVVAITAQDRPAGTAASSTGELPWGTAPEGELPAFCAVTVIVRPQITIEIWLPKENWNRRFRAEGGGGYGGYINYVGMVDALRGGYATASTDTGHHFRVGGAFGLNRDGSLNEALIEDFAWRSLHELTTKAKAVIRAYYGESPRYSYWRGGSNGGREGLGAVQRFPEEYDGVLAAAPAINWEKYLLGVVAWQYVVVQQEVGHPIERAKLVAVNRAAIAACDTLDGVADGLIGDPRQCRFDPGALVCQRKKNVESCLSEPEARAIRKIWNGPTRAETTERVWFGVERGADLSRLSNLNPGGQALEHLLWTKHNPSFDWRTLKEEDFDGLIRKSTEQFEGTLGTDNANLQGFRARGGKLLIWHGESDELIPPRGIVRYFDRVVAANGGAKEVGTFARLFLLPGIGHGSRDGLFPRATPTSDGWFSVWFEALVEWVEKGIAPDRIVASQALPGGAMRTRPLCAYPKVAKWTGRGSTDEAANFTCVTGKHRPEDFRVSDEVVKSSIEHH